MDMDPTRDFPSRPAARRRPVILVVEDPELAAYPVSRLLRFHGFDTMAAASNAQAMALATDRRVDLVVVDRLLADGDCGLDFLAAFRRVTPYVGTPVIFIADGLAANSDDHERAVTAGATVFHNPKSLGTIVEAVSGLTGVGVGRA
jgi:CheY-like chemotaxis protein